MRPKGVIGVLVVVLLAVGLLYLLSDALIENSIESAGSSAVGAKVEIDNLDFDLLGLAISMDRLQVTNPNDTWKNLFETSRLAFDMEFAPLLRKKVIINEITVADIRVGTKRETDGKLPDPPDESEPGWSAEFKKQLKQQVEKAPVLKVGNIKQKVNVDSLVAAFDIQSLQKIETAREDAEATFTRWQNEIADFKPKQDLDQLAQQVDELKTTEVNRVEDLIQTLDKAKKVHSTLKEVKSDVDNLKNNLATDLGNVRATFASVDNWIADDISAIKSKANIGDFTPQGIAKMLFGEAIMMPALDMFEYVRLARKYMPMAKQAMATTKVEKPPRFEGQTIDFPLQRGLPKFLIENVLISGKTNQEDTTRVLSLSGEMHGITSQQKLYGKPLTMDLQARLPGSKAFSVDGLFSRLGEVAEDRLQLKASGMRLGNVQLPDKPYLPASLATNRSDITTNLDVVGNRVDFKVNFLANAVDFRFPADAKTDAVARVTRSVFESIENLRVTASIAGLTTSPGLSISSNVDDVLAQRIKGVLGEAANEARAEIEKRVRAKVEPKKQEALALVDEKRSELTRKVSAYEERVNAITGRADEKIAALKSEIDKKKGEGLEKATDKLKGLFDKDKKKDEPAEEEPKPQE